MALDLFPGDVPISGDQLATEIEAYVRVEGANVVPASSTTQTIPDPASNTPNSDVTLTANCTFTLPTAGRGKGFIVSIKQDGTGGRVPTFTGAWWAGGVVPTWSTSAGKTDIVSFLCIDGTHWVGSALIDVR